MKRRRLDWLLGKISAYEGFVGGEASEVATAWMGKLTCVMPSHLVWYERRMLGAVCSSSMQPHVLTREEDTNFASLGR